MVDLEFGSETNHNEMAQFRSQLHWFLCDSKHFNDNQFDRHEFPLAFN